MGSAHYQLKVLYVSFFLEETLMWFSLYLRSSKTSFFPKIGALWIQAHILFIFRVTIVSIGIRASQRFNQSSKMSRGKSTHIGDDDSPKVFPISK
ncbi:unnamed protein product [Spirodela intermedia]|uniref:Uncharacterized protein n=1 Tax=Spirodela intermedia TaxID=51605 RepID=A0A7I8LGU0_SPIIN|nr:unnamed protein product [Spirodela intermedia]